MSRPARPLDPRLTALALALAGAFAPAQAQTAAPAAPAQQAPAAPAQPAPAAAEAEAADADAAPTTVVDSSVSAGIGLVSGDRQDRLLYDQYNGLRPGANVFGLFGADYYRRDDKRGASVRFEALDLLTGNRELGLRWKRHGDWAFSATYRELVRRETATPNSGLIGAGSANPQVVPLLGGPGTGDDIDLKIKRTGLGAAFSKVISPRLEFTGSIQSEHKEGARLFGIGMACPSSVAPGCGVNTGVQTGWAVLMLPEPLDSDHSQVEARLSYADAQLRVSGGYYGSFYRNDYGSLRPNVPDSLYNPLRTSFVPLAPGLQSILNQPVALPPDNQAHHLDLTGVYLFTRTTQLNFKLGYSVATQHQNFAASGLGGAPAGVNDLDGKMVTTLAQVGLRARPSPKLSLFGNLRYEHRDDRTPIALYNIEGTSRYTNQRLPLTRAEAKVQAAYQLTADYRGTVDATYKSVDHGVFTPTSAAAGITALREETEETGLRAELRRRMSDVLSGAVSVEASKRTGSNWLQDNSGLGVTEVPDPSATSTNFATGIFMPNLADRERHKLKVHADWQPTDKLSLQLVADTGRDKYKVPSAYGVRKSATNQISIDGNFTVNDNWSLNGYVSRGRQELDQSRPGAAIMAFDNKVTTLGLGFTGKPTGKLEVGGGLMYMNDKNIYAQTLDATADAGSAVLLAATGGLPDIVFRQTTLKLFGKYTLNKQSAIRVDLAHQRSTWNDWAWNYNGTPFVYSDGTTVNRKPKQNVSFVGVSYTYRWQ